MTIESSNFRITLTVAPKVGDVLNFLVSGAAIKGSVASNTRGYYVSLDDFTNASLYSKIGVEIPAFATMLGLKPTIHEGVAFFKTLENLGSFLHGLFSYLENTGKSAAVAVDPIEKFFNDNPGAFEGYRDKLLPFIHAIQQDIKGVPIEAVPQVDVKLGINYLNFKDTLQKPLVNGTPAIFRLEGANVELEIRNVDGGWKLVHRTKNNNIVYTTTKFNVDVIVETFGFERVKNADVMLAKEDDFRKLLDMLFDFANRKTTTTVQYHYEKLLAAEPRAFGEYREPAIQVAKALIADLRAK